MGFVYLINVERSDLYKIGITKKSIEERMRALQTGSAKKLVIVDSYKSHDYRSIETVMHRILKHKKYIAEDFDTLKGEWFMLTFEEVSSFKNQCETIEKSLKFIKDNSTLDIDKVL